MSTGTALVLLMVEGLLQLVGPILTQRVIDVALPTHDAAMAMHAALLYAGSLVLAFGCSYGETMLTALLGQRVMRDLRQQLFEHVQHRAQQAAHRGVALLHLLAVHRQRDGARRFKLDQGRDGRGLEGHASDQDRARRGNRTIEDGCSYRGQVKGRYLDQS